MKRNWKLKVYIHFVACKILFPETEMCPLQLKQSLKLAVSLS